MNRRRWLRDIGGIGLGLSLFGAELESGKLESEAGPYQLFWGDLHNHNGVTSKNSNRGQPRPKDDAA